MELFVIASGSGSGGGGGSGQALINLICAMDCGTNEA